MSKLGENAERILEKLNNREKLSVNEIEKTMADAATLLDFMKECGFIELKNGEIKITDFGSNLLTVA